MKLLKQVAIEYYNRNKPLKFVFEGKEGLDRIHQMMARICQNPPQVINEVAVVAIEDYLKRSVTFPETGQKEPLLLPKSDVLLFRLADKTKIVVRPSGTEPKIKLYCGAVSKHSFHDNHALEKALVDCDHKAEEYLLVMKKLLGL